MNATIRPALTADAAALSELGRRTFAEAFGADNSPEDLRHFLESTYQPEIQHRELLDQALAYLVAESAGELVGFALLRRNKVSPHVSDPTAIEVQRFYLDKSFQGTGLAQRLMAACVEYAATLGAGTLFLGVWEQNPRAISFYRRQGFEEVGRQIFQVGSDPQRDLVLARRISPPHATASYAAP